MDEHERPAVAVGVDRDPAPAELLGLDRDVGSGGLGPAMRDPRLLGNLGERHLPERGEHWGMMAET